MTVSLSSNSSLICLCSHFVIIKIALQIDDVASFLDKIYFQSFVTLRSAKSNSQNDQFAHKNPGENQEVLPPNPWRLGGAPVRALDRNSGTLPKISPLKYYVFATTNVPCQIYACQQQKGDSDFAAFEVPNTCMCFVLFFLTILMISNIGKAFSKVSASTSQLSSFRSA